MKKIVLILAVALAFASCKKEELEPAPDNNNNPPTGITAKTVSFAESGFGTNGSVYLTNPNGLDFSPAAGITGCGMGSVPENFSLQAEVTYGLQFTIGTTVVYEGDIKITSGGNLVELTGNQAGSATVALDNCNSAIGDQIVVSP